jgi:hypothetical protein
VWCQASQVPQSRELRCRTLEANGDEPPEIPDEALRNFPENARLLIAEAFVRRDGLRAAKAAAAEQKLTAAKAAAEEQRTTAERQQAAIEEAEQYANSWTRHPEVPALFPEDHVTPGIQTAQTKGNTNTLFSSCGHYQLKSRPEDDKECEATWADHDFSFDNAALPKKKDPSKIKATKKKETIIAKTNADDFADDIQTELKLRKAANAAEDALIESLSLACNLVDLKLHPVKQK